MRSPGLAGILSLAWKILRGAEVASTEMAMVVGVADQLHSEKEKKRTQITPRNLESFIFIRPPWYRRGSHCRILDSSSHHRAGTGTHARCYHSDDVTAREIHYLRRSRRNRQEYADAKAGSEAARSWA